MTATYISALHCCDRYLAHSFTLILPFFPTGTMERVDTEGQIATAKVSTSFAATTKIWIRPSALGFLKSYNVSQEASLIHDYQQ